MYTVFGMKLVYFSATNKTFVKLGNFGILFPQNPQQVRKSLCSVKKSKTLLVIAQHQTFLNQEQSVFRKNVFKYRNLFHSFNLRMFVTSFATFIYRLRLKNLLDRKKYIPFRTENTHMYISNGY